MRSGGARRRYLAALAAVGGLGLLAPAYALGHGLVTRADLPIPQWLFIWGAGLVLLVSFLALGVLWRAPLLQDRDGRALLRFPAGAEVAAGVVGVLTFAGLVACGLAGSASPNANLLPTVVYVVFWVGLVVVSAIFGDVFRALNPWRAAARAGRWALGRRAGSSAAAPFAYPPWLGRWPAAAGILAFGWLELVDPHGDEPRRLALIALAYAGVQLVGMVLFGVERFGAGADAFGVYFGLFARISPLHVRDRVLRVRRPLAGLDSLQLLPGTVAVLCVAIGVTIFDGAQSVSRWTSWAGSIERHLGDAGVGIDRAVELAETIGLVGSVLLVAAIYQAGVWGMRATRAVADVRGLAAYFAPSLVPIALAYVVAHYFTLIVYQGQALGYLISDPLGNGSDLFGTAGAGIDYGLISTEVVWYVEVAALVAGHLAALAVAHDRALVMFRSPAAVLRSQLCMLAVMIAFTCFGLWLLSA